MPKRIIIVRHGETDHNRQKVIQGHTDVLLNSTGLRQAIRAADKLSEEKIDIIYTSDLKRTYQTAQIIAYELKMVLNPTKLIRERFFGDIEGLKDTEVKKFHKNFSWEDGFIDSASKYLKIETDESMKKRVNIFINQLKTNYKEKTVLVVTHGGIIHILLDIFGVSSLGDKEKELFKNTSITYLEKRGEDYSIKKVLNDNGTFHY